jgi:hypothetical protein
MSIGKQLIGQLERLASGESVLTGLPSGDMLYKRLVALEEPTQTTLEFFDYDRYSVALRELVVGMSVDAPTDTRTYLSATAAAVARGLSFLEEPLAVWELDGSAGIAQLRSSPPLREGDEVSYWEVTLTADQPSARAARYHWAPGMLEREIVAYPATFALLGRMADALAGALRDMAD